MRLEEWHRWWKSSGAHELRSLLMAEWDPIGVEGVPQARDEYDSYLGPLAEKLRKGAGASAVDDYLTWIQTERMGLPAAPAKTLAASEKVVAWYAAEMKS